jgi:hypothetical protein
MARSEPVLPLVPTPQPPSHPFYSFLYFALPTLYLVLSTLFRSHSIQTFVHHGSSISTASSVLIVHTIHSSSILLILM